MSQGGDWEEWGAEDWEKVKNRADSWAEVRALAPSLNWENTLNPEGNSMFGMETPPNQMAGALAADTQRLISGEQD